MCHERFLRRRTDKSEESRELWRDFERTSPVADSDPRAETADAERAEVEEQVTTLER
jgi:hypothetical protein